MGAAEVDMMHLMMSHSCYSRKGLCGHIIFCLSLLNFVMVFLALCSFALCWGVLGSVKRRENVAQVVR